MKYVCNGVLKPLIICGMFAEYILYYENLSYGNYKDV